MQMARRSAKKFRNLGCLKFGNMDTILMYYDISDYDIVDFEITYPTLPQISSVT